MVTQPGELGRRIRVARKLADLRVAEVAAAFELLPISVYRWECGRRKPSLEQLELLASLCDVDVTWLTFGHGEPRKPARKRASAE